MFTRYPFLSRLVLFICIPSILITWWLLDVYLLQSLPDTKKVYHLDWQTGSIELSRDENGVAIIKSRDLDGVHFAMGFAHAQDRLWQLELQRRISQGRLAELFGKSALNQDMLFRTLGIYRAAQNAYESLNSEARASLRAYTSGINHFLAQNNDLPIEFHTLGVKPEPWSEVDSLAWLKVFALSLSGNYNAELQRLLVTRYLPRELQATFFADLGKSPDELADLPTESAEFKRGLTSLLQTNLSLSETWHIGGNAVGSNAWAVSGKHTQSGKPILASDPHLGLQLPSLWYAVVQNTNTMQLSGMSLVGIPMVVFGKNDHFAWGGTNMQADAQDLKIETLKSDDQNYYWSGTRWSELSTRVEKIRVKADFPAFLKPAIEPINLMVRETHNGPIISDHLGINDVTLSLRWTGLDKRDRTYEALFEMNQAADWSGFRTALKKFKAPAMNIVYADLAGNIALQGIGALPLRKQHNGAFPVGGKRTSDIWDGYVPFEKMPLVFNPVSGYVANANNHISRQGPDISVDEVEKTRIRRIEQRLKSVVDGEAQVTVDDMKSMQQDILDRSVDPLLQVMVNLSDPSPREAEIIQTLKAWDRQASAESIAASIYDSGVKNIKKQLFDKRLSQVWSPNSETRVLLSLKARVTSDKLAEIMSQDDIWCLLSTEKTENACVSKLRLALREAIDEMSLLVGEDTEDWRWGDFHYVAYSHQPFSQINGLKALFGREYRTGGSANTLHVAGSRYQDKLGYRKEFGAGFRQIITLDDKQPKFWLAHAGGQSGQFMSQHYDDMLISFEHGEFIALPIANQSSEE